MFRSFDPDDLTAFGGDSFTYSSENLLKTATVSGVLTALQYDPLLRLYQTNSAGVPIARFAYDGLNALAEYNSSGTLQRRWVFDPTTGQPVVWYEGSGTSATAKRYLSADERGSIISVSDSTGAALSINTYDEYGIPAAGNLGRYGYTGQAWLGAAKLWYLNARMYSPAIGGTFLQPDPIGYAGGINIYVYTGGDPVNYVDPLGLAWQLVKRCRGAMADLGEGTAEWGTVCYLDYQYFPEPRGPRMRWDVGLIEVGGVGGTTADGDEEQDEFCKGLATDVANSKAALSGFITNFSAWNDIDRLRSERDWIQGDLNDLRSIQNRLGTLKDAIDVGGPLVGFGLKGSRGAIVGGISAFAVRNLQSRVASLQRQVDAMNARIRQLQAIHAQKC